MIGAIVGDIVGSRFEFDNIKSKDFDIFHPDCCWTDDSVMTLAADGRGSSTFMSRAATGSRLRRTEA